MAKWRRNICEDCKYKWHPRGHRLSANCPKCKSSNVRIYKNWFGRFIAIHFIVFAIAVFANNDYSWEGISSSLKAKRGWADPSSIDANAYLWKIGKIFIQCASVYLIPLSIVVYTSVLKKSSDTDAATKPLQMVAQLKPVKRLDAKTGRNNNSKSARWDVFISHASEDKEDFVRPLANALKHRGLNAWHNIDLQDVQRFSPTLADRVAVSSSIGIEKVAKAITDAMAAN
jgi:hypothetical protein